MRKRRNKVSGERVWVGAWLKFTKTHRKISTLALGVIMVLIATPFVYVESHRIPTAPYNNHPIGSNITVSGKKVPVSLKATPVSHAPVPLKGFGLAAPAVSITPSGPLPAPITLTFKLTKPATKDTPIVVATRETTRDSWSYIVPTVSPDGRYVTFQTDHMSFYSILKDTEDFTLDLEGDLGKAIVENLSGVNIEKAKQPSCQDSTGVLQDNYSYSFTNSGGNAVLWCLGIENGSRVLKVVNNKNFPLLLSRTDGLTNISDGHITADLDQFARLSGTSKEVATFPGDEADFDVDLNVNQAAELEALWNGEASTLDLLQSGLIALSTIISHSSAGKALTANDTYVVMNTVLSAQGCFNAVESGDAAHVLVDCLGDAAKDGLLSESKNLALAYVQAFGAVASSVYGDVSGLLSSFGPNGGSLFSIIFHRNAQSSQVQSTASAPSSQGKSTTVTPPQQNAAAPAVSFSSFVGTWQNGYQGSYHSAPATWTTTFIVRSDGNTFTLDNSPSAVDSASYSVAHFSLASAQEVADEQGGTKYHIAGGIVATSAQISSDGEVSNAICGASDIDMPSIPSDWTPADLPSCKPRASCYVSTDCAFIIVPVASGVIGIPNLWDNEPGFEFYFCSANASAS